MEWIDKGDELTRLGEYKGFGITYGPLKHKQYIQCILKPCLFYTKKTLNLVDLSLKLIKFF